MTDKHTHKPYSRIMEIVVGMAQQIQSQCERVPHFILDAELRSFPFDTSDVRVILTNEELLGL